MRWRIQNGRKVHSNHIHIDSLQYQIIKKDIILSKLYLWSQKCFIWREILWILSWIICGVLQGEKVAVLEGDSVAVVCYDSSRKNVHGMLYWKESGDSLHRLIQCLHVNDIEIVPMKRLSFRNVKIYTKSYLYVLRFCWS